MPESGPSLEEWRNLYEAAIRVKEIAPWEWMEETDIFGVQDPETEVMGFVSVMGMLGEHIAVAVYLGPKGLYYFWALGEMGDDLPPEALLTIPHLQVAFVGRSELSQTDRNLIKKLGLRFRGRQAWPRFRSYRPGYFPWHLEAPEARFLTCALEQTAEMAPEFRDDPALLDRPDDETYLVRMPREEKGVVTWEERLTKVPPSEPEPIPIVMDIGLLEEVKKLPEGREALEVDLFRAPTATQDEGRRPYFAFVLLSVDGNTGLILGHEMLKPEPNVEEAWGRVPLTLVRQFARMGTVPRRIAVQSPLVSELLDPLIEELGIEVEQRRVLRNLNEAWEFLRERI